MLRKIHKFLADETGAVTVDMVVVLGGTTWMAMVLLTDIYSATVQVTNVINDRLSYESIIADIYDGYGPDAASGSGGTTGDDGMADDGESDDGSNDHGSSNDDSSDEDSGHGNPGNDKDVGHAGENPNGKGGWGSGSRGRSD